jgi:hypothetical protein
MDFVAGLGLGGILALFALAAIGGIEWEHEVDLNLRDMPIEKVRLIHAQADEILGEELLGRIQAIRKA